MLVTRLAYVLILAIIGSAVVAAAVVAWPDRAAAPPSLAFERVVDYGKFGVVSSIDADGQDLTVRFRDDFDTTPLQTRSRTFTSQLPAGQDLLQTLSAAGIAANVAGGVKVTIR